MHNNLIDMKKNEDQNILLKFILWELIYNAFEAIC